MSTYDLTVEQVRVIFSQLPDDLQRVGAGVHFTLSEDRPDFGALTVPDSAASLVGPIVAATPADAVLTPTPNELLAYANAKQWALATGGFSVTVAGASRVFATDVTSLTMMDGKVARLAQPSPPATINWQIGANAWLTVAAADFPAIATACADFVQATFDTLKAVGAAIVAGTIITFAQIDDPTTMSLAAWPHPEG